MFFKCASKVFLKITESFGSKKQLKHSLGFPNLGFLSFGGLLTDLSKAFDCLHRDLLIAKLHAYGLDLPSLELLHSYLTKRIQRVKIDNTYRSWSEILFGVSQGSILGPLLFNIFLYDLFVFVPEIGIATYADDNTLHATNKHLETLHRGSDTLLKCFTDNILNSFMTEAVII